MSNSKQQKKRKKDRYDVMMLPSDGGKVKQFKFSMNVFIRSIVTLVVLFALLICYSVYCTQAIQGVHSSIGSADEKLQKIKDENTKLVAENAELSEAINSLNTVIADMEKEAQVAEVTKSEQSIPTGFPLDGSASLMNDRDAENVGNATPAPGDDKRVVFTATVGTAVMAAGTGIISEVSDEGTYGHVIKIDHQNGYETIYYSSANVRVMQGDEVEKGDVICIMTQDNELLAYQIMQDGKYIDPMSLMEIAG